MAFLVGAMPSGAIARLNNAAASREKCGVPHCGKVQILLIIEVCMKFVATWRAASR